MSLLYKSIITDDALHIFKTPMVPTLCVGTLMETLLASHQITQQLGSGHPWNNMKKRKKKIKKHITLKKKMSEIVLEYASDYISMGETLEERQCLLNSACSAWNFSLLSTEERGNAVQEYLKEYKKYNPNADAIQCNAVIENILKLIDVKLKKFHNIKKSIINAHIEDINGRDHVTVASMRNEN